MIKKLIGTEEHLDYLGKKLIINHYETEMFGLKYEPLIEDTNYLEHPWYQQYPFKKDPNNEDFYGPYVCLFWGNTPAPKHFSNQNAQALSDAIDSMEKIDTILEVGVHRPDNSADISSTKIIIDKKRKDAIYLGVDVNDKSDFDSYENNIHTMVCDSAQTGMVIEKLNSIGVQKLDLIFIDGDHSILYAFNDWKFAELLNVGGKIIFHDVNQHTGPMELVKAIDTDMFKVEVFCPPTDDCHDFGIGVFTRIK